jgi:serine-type D-Ala-D-Ala carboxypeptidase/endopeptidase (penicillin-binding protein 4)
MRAVYYRRRAGVGVSAVVSLWLVIQILTSVAGWMTGTSDHADASSSATGDLTRAAAVPTTAPAVCPAPDERFPAATEEAPDALLGPLEAALGTRSLEVRDSGVSVWVEGYGVVADDGGDLALAPASNQKILTAMGVLELLDHDQRLITEIRATGPVTADGVVQGDLVVVGGGDPLIKRQGPHSVEDLARRMARTGITAVEGDIVGDESRYDQVRKAPGWLDWEMPLPGGAMSALMVNSNSRLGDAAYLADPTLHNAELVMTALDDAGVAVEGEATVGVAPEGSEVIFEYRSPTVAEMVRTMLRHSDNMTAEMLAKEVGLQVRGEGSTEAGLAAMTAALEESLCLEIEGFDDDASGISRENRRSANQWRDLLLAARDAPWFETFHEAMPVAGDQDGTLVLRFLGTSAVGNVAAKTGTIGTAVALSGYAETEGGREVVFSVVVNGDQPEKRAVPAMDAVVITVQADES